jgi:tetratricopeptide (TPR) repeat protein
MTNLAPYFLAFGLIVTAMVAQVGGSATELKLGIASYDDGLYPEAIRHLERAVSLDPNSIEGHYYLALASDVICPGANACDLYASTAVREYRKVLELDSSNKDALKDLAHLMYKIRPPKEAEDLYRRAVTLDPNDPEALYSVAVITWWRAYRELMSEKVRFGVKPREPLTGLAACGEVHRKISKDVEEAITLLEKSADLANYEETQTYLAVSYMVRAEIQCDDKAAYIHDRKTEKEWWNRACLTHNGPQDLTNPRRGRWFPGQQPAPARHGDRCIWSRPN